MIPGVAPTQGQHLVLGLVKPHDIPKCPFLELVQVPLGGIPFLRACNYTNHLAVLCKIVVTCLKGHSFKFFHWYFSVVF